MTKISSHPPRRGRGHSLSHRHGQEEGLIHDYRGPRQMQAWPAVRDIPVDAVIRRT